MQGHYLFYSIHITDTLKELPVRTIGVPGVGGFR